MEGVNIMKRHTRPSQKNPQGGIVQREAPIHVSNVMLLDPKQNQPARVRHQRGEGRDHRQEARHPGEQRQRARCCSSRPLNDDDEAGMSDEKSKKPKKEAQRPAKEKEAPAEKAPKAKGPREKVVDSIMYREQVIPTLMKRFQYSNVMQVPRLEKIAINMGVGIATQDAKMVEVAAKDLEAIVGQKVVITRAKKSISNFKLREKMPIGCRVTLRRTVMYEFLDRFISVTVPRIRDLRGLSDTSLTGAGTTRSVSEERYRIPGDRCGQDRADLRYGHHIRHDRADGQRRRRNCCAPSACRS